MVPSAAMTGELLLSGPPAEKAHFSAPFERGPKPKDVLWLFLPLLGHDAPGWYPLGATVSVAVVRPTAEMVVVL